MSIVPLTVRLDFDWDRLKLNKQTLFPVRMSGGEAGQAERGDIIGTRLRQRLIIEGKPIGNGPWRLRATKGVNMHPSPVLRLYSSQEIPRNVEEIIHLTLVDAITHEIPLRGDEFILEMKNEDVDMLKRTSKKINLK